MSASRFARPKHLADIQEIGFSLVDLQEGSSRAQRVPIGSVREGGSESGLVNVLAQVLLRAGSVQSWLIRHDGCAACASSGNSVLCALKASQDNIGVVAGDRKGLRHKLVQSSEGSGICDFESFWRWFVQQACVLEKNEGRSVPWPGIRDREPDVVVEWPGGVEHDGSARRVSVADLLFKGVFEVRSRSEAVSSQVDVRYESFDMFEVESRDDATEPQFVTDLCAQACKMHQRRPVQMPRLLAIRISRPRQEGVSSIGSGAIVAEECISFPNCGKWDLYAVVYVQREKRGRSRVSCAVRSASVGPERLVCRGRDGFWYFSDKGAPRRLGLNISDYLQRSVACLVYEPAFSERALASHAGHTLQRVRLPDRPAARPLDVREFVRSRMESWNRGDAGSFKFRGPKGAAVAHGSAASLSQQSTVGARTLGLWQARQALVRVAYAQAFGQSHGVDVVSPVDIVDQTRFRAMVVALSPAIVESMQGALMHHFGAEKTVRLLRNCLLYTSPSPRD